MPQDWRYLAQNSLLAYSIAMQPGYAPGPHHYVLADALEKVYSGKIKRLMVFMPPQHGKSQLASGHFPPWAIGKSQGKYKIAFATYNQTYANFWGKQVDQSIVQERAYSSIFPGVKLNPKGSEGMSQIDFLGGGWYMATSVGGGLTGKGPDVIIIDDPVKDYEEASSETIQMRQQDWLSTVVRTRLPKAIIVIMTRWHESDLSGWLQEQSKINGEEWHVISFPAIAESSEDPLGRKVGEALWPAKITAPELLKIKSSIPPQHWVSMFQQRPTAIEGGIFQRSWWRYYSLPPREMVKSMEVVIQSWDMAFKGKETNSKVAGLVIGRRAADFYLLDICNEHMNFPTSIQAVLQTTARWPESDAKYVEDKANGPAVIQTLNEVIPGLIAVPKDISKEAAWHGASPYAASGNCYLPQAAHCPKVGDFVEQLAGLPNSKFNDMADAWSQGIYKLKDAGTTGLIEYYKMMAAKRVA